MTDKRVVLVTGVASYWGGQVAAKLLEREEVAVIGIDAEKPEQEALRDLDFIRADLSSPLMADLLKEERVHTVCHLDFVESTRPHERIFESNTMGTMRLLAASVEAGVQKIVLRSSTMAYGARPSNPGFITEDAPLHGSKLYGYTRDWVEIEAFCNGFRRQNPSTALVILRFASIIGPSVKSPMTRFLSHPEMPILFGFDPRMQVIHEADAIAALLHAANTDVDGTFNVAAEGIFPLWKVVSLAGKLAVPVIHPLAYWGASVAGERLAPMDLDYLRYTWVADLRRMREELNFTPMYTAEETLREFAGQQRLRNYWPGMAKQAEEQLRDTIERRKRARARQAED